jgi:hypothetical protein
MKESGIGRENGVEALEACVLCPISYANHVRLTSPSSDSQSKSTIVNIATADETRQKDDWFAEVGEAKRYG